MGAVAEFLLGNWKLVAIALLTAAVGVQTHRLESAQAERDAARATHAAYKAQVVEEHDRAVAAAKSAEAAAIQRAKEADDANRKKYADLDAAYAGYRMRVGAGGAATASLVPAAASGAGVDPGLCYTRETLNRELGAAIGRLRAGIAGDAEPYDRATVTAKTCRDWALGLR